jgi:UDP-3-O-[3-hydroxymyristoyl] glucosamine N-acyltransferase
VPTIIEIPLEEIASKFNLESFGDSRILISGVASLKKAKPDHIVFIQDSQHLKSLESSAAGAVIIGDNLEHPKDIPFIISEHPYLDFIKIAKLFIQKYEIYSSQDETEYQSLDSTEGVKVHTTVSLDPSTIIREGSIIHPNVVIGKNVTIGGNVSIHPNVVIYDSVAIGDEVTIQSGAVIGSQGFGYLETKEGWLEIPHLGGVKIGNNVMIGANCTIDRGTLDDTEIADGVKLDNLVHVAHNVYIGANTAIAATTGIAGSTIIGKNCKVGGRVSIMGHINIADDVTLTANSLITKSILKSGIYSGGIPSEEVRVWRKVIAKLKREAKGDA